MSGYSLVHYTIPHLDEVLTLVVEEAVPLPAVELIARARVRPGHCAVIEHDGEAHRQAFWAEWCGLTAAAHIRTL